MGIQLLPDIGSTQKVVFYAAGIGLQVLIFLLTLGVLSFFVFRPLLEVFGLRKRHTEVMEKEVESLITENEVLKEEHSWRMEGAVQLAADKRNMVEMIGKRRAEMLLMEARRESRRDLKNVKNRVSQAYSETILSAKQSVSDFARDVAKKVLNS